MSTTDYLRCPFCEGVPSNISENLLNVFAQMDLLNSKQFAIEYYNANKRVEDNKCDSITYSEEYWLNEDGILNIRASAHCHNCKLNWGGELNMKPKQLDVKMGK